jgi:Phage capsid family.
MRKLQLSGLFVLVTLALFCLPVMLLGPTAEAASLTVGAIALAAYLVEPAEFDFHRGGLFLQRGEVGEGMTLAALEKALRENMGEFKKYCEKAEGELKETGKASAETKAALEKLIADGNKIFERLDKLEARADRALGDGDRKVKTVGEMFTASEEAKALMGGRGKQARVQVKDIVNATGQNQPLVPAMRVPGIIADPTRRLTIRDLLPIGRTGSNLIEYTKELLFSNAAGPQYEASPERFENIKKNKSDITFQLATAAVVTLAHYIKASKQVLADSPQLESYINGRLTYGLKLEEEDEILNGTGAAGELDGLVHQATAFNRGQSYDTKIDLLRKVITQVAISEFSLTGFVLNPQDWEEIELSKDTQGRYIVADPNGLLAARLWSFPVVSTNSMPRGSFLGGAFSMCAQLWDREDAAVQVGYENDDFTKNMVTMLAEERLALTVFRPSGLVKGSF